MLTLVTGAAGFIGYHVAEALLRRGEPVVGIDNLNAYYDPALKHARLARLTGRRGFRFHHMELGRADAVEGIVAACPDAGRIVHLAAQAGVRHSMVDPFAYVTANVTGHLAVLEAARRLRDLRHLVYASSSSVYGTDAALPFAEGDKADQPASIYAATKRADELMSAAYTHLYGLRQTGLRFFTVYGPWGRPDMAYYSFARAIMAGQPVTLYDGGQLKRDFTYIDDIVGGILACADAPPAGSQHRVLNIGNDRSETVVHLVQLLEQHLGRRAELRYAPRPAADMTETRASLDALSALTGFRPSTRLEDGVARFCAWFRNYHGTVEKGVDAPRPRA